MPLKSEKACASFDGGFTLDSERDLERETTVLNRNLESERTDNERGDDENDELKFEQEDEEDYQEESMDVLLRRYYR
ncbi:unnamed protein product [Bursaphelenchus xylophilus]|uniref:(pine wood nematode) hypothetical protein n=1 Tax=Bursaphelenchus xylophilus TaxID=6326 RepID=A0A1I7RVY3_BURXY|nr:unnamed protein product [Bursaphelenchus xylophilus]CAG9094876.1 unnamed protein product [Bursaphelenchus xylophilus]